MRVACVVAVDRNLLIGRAGSLPWNMPADLAHFKRLTMGKPIIMGRATHVSIGRPLPGRLNIVLSRSKSFAAEGCTVVPTLEAALEAAGDCAEAMVIGGAQIYVAFLPRTDRIYMTRVEATYEGDVLFPTLEQSEWVETQKKVREPDEKNRETLTFLTLDRR